MTRIYDLISKIRSFREGIDYSISKNDQEKSYTIHSRELQKTLRKELSDFPWLVEKEWNMPILSIEQNRSERFIYQGDGGNSFDKLIVAGGSSNFGFLENQSSFSRVREITNTNVEVRAERQGVEARSSFPSFSPINRTTNDYHRDENRETRQGEFEARQRELKEQEEKLAAEKKKLEEEMKAEVQQNRPQNFQPNRNGQGGSSIPPDTFWPFVLHILALAGVFL